MDHEINMWFVQLAILQMLQVVQSHTVHILDLVVTPVHASLTLTS